MATEIEKINKQQKKLAARKHQTKPKSTQKRFKKIILSLLLGIFLIGLGFVVLIFSFDYRIQNETEQTLNNELSSKNYTTLKQQTDPHTFHYLKKQNTVDLSLSTDNQGSGDLAYYPLKINGKDDFGLKAKFNNIFFPNAKLQKVWYQKD